MSLLLIKPINMVNKMNKKPKKTLQQPNNLKILSQEELKFIVGGNYEGPPDPPPDPDPIGAHRN